MCSLSYIFIGLGISLGSVSLLIVGWWLYKIIKKRREKKLKEKYFQQNGGLLLQQKLSSSPEFNVDIIKLFKLEDLEKATDHFNADRVLGKGGQGTVYKGMLADGKIVAVKKLKVHGNVEDFINEIVILAQINHRNVVKLLGCCLEAEFPLLVYEFIPNGTLFYHLHEENEELPMTWDMRLRIAVEVAGALFYLHSAASQPIYHRDIKSTNILLDEKYRAKVADFGASRLMSNIEVTHVTTRVHGTFGYLDPGYYYTGQLTEKSDVYSFGVVLIELLTGQKAVSSIGSDGYAKSLASYFRTCMDDNCLFDILDENVMKEGDKEHIMVIAKLANRCLNLNGKERPTMREVTIELVGIQNLEKKGNDHHNSHGIDLSKTNTRTPRDIQRCSSLNLELISNSETSSSSDVRNMLHPTYP
ncbi:hypothetical protein L6164_000416 [Bauhinia variegata]|uniref:Uncharacterized protein n=1 Tax=Bauhinia variegata TaxID=167791 RepID=A0ACB9Q8J3_BAUVA|nr:hypothetical protein L6164_000416 [Bauhinia variegata]